MADERRPQADLATEMRKEGIDPNTVKEFEDIQTQDAMGDAKFASDVMQAEAQINALEMLNSVEPVLIDLLAGQTDGAMFLRPETTIKGKKFMQNATPKMDPIKDVSDFKGIMQRVEMIRNALSLDNKSPSQVDPEFRSYLMNVLETAEKAFGAKVAKPLPEPTPAPGELPSR